MNAYKLLLLTLFILVLGACQMESENSETGELSIELTDAKGDFTNYTVDVTSLSLTNRNGSIIEVIPETTRVDFSQYVDMSEFLTLATVPRGIYTSATLRLNYQNAEIHVENEDGSSAQVDTIQDEENNPVTTLESKVSFTEANQLHILPGVPAHLSLDFDLKTSNAVDFDENDIPSITVSPILIASLAPDLNKTHRIRGPLKNVNINNTSFDLIVRPFNNKLKDEHERFGALSVSTNENTFFEIDNNSLIGNEGLVELATLARLTAVIVVGDISFNPRRFMAAEVYAGESVPGGTMDVVRGTILSRIDNTIFVRGATLTRADGSVFFNDDVSVLLDTTTTVKRQNDTNDYTIDDISVGQAVTIFGSLNEDAADLVLDASAGHVRMRVTSIRGTIVNQDDVAKLELDLQSINGRRINLYDFSGTGANTENDANPTAYEIETGNLNIQAFSNNAPIRVRGFVNSFGQAPTDFIAKSIIGVKTIQAVMHTNWRPASPDAFSRISTDAITLNFSNTGKFHHLGRGGQRIDLNELSTEFTLVPGDSNQGLFIIQSRDSKQAHSTFDTFANALQEQMDNEKLVKKLKAKGLFDGNTGNFSARRIHVHLQ